MPNIKSAKKRVLIAQKKNLQNRMLVSSMKTALRKINDAIDTNNIELAEQLLPSTFSIIDKTASKGAIHQNAANNKKSSLAKKINAIKTGKLVITIKKSNEQIAAEKARAAAKVRETQKAEQAKKQAEKAIAKAEVAKTKGKKDAKGKVDKSKDAKEKVAAKPTKETPKVEDKKPTEKKSDAKDKKVEDKKPLKDDKKAAKEVKKSAKEEKVKPAKKEKPAKEKK